MRRLLGAAALLFAVATTPLWSDFGVLAGTWRLSYAERRERLALRLPVEEVAALLDRELAPDAPVALGRGLRNERVRQRLTEALYPRIVADAAPAVLERAHGEFSLRGGPRLDRPGPERRESLDLDPFGAALAAAALLGTGVLLVRIARALVPALPWRAAPLLAIAALGLAANLGTWLEVPLLTRTSLWLALGAAAAGLAWSRRALAGARPALPLSLPIAALAALVLAIGLRMLLLPVADWDGRSIWLFHAKQLFFHGMLARADLLRASFAFGHPEYPLELPAVLAFFALPAAAYDERLAAVGLVFLVVSLAAVLFLCARDLLGTRSAALLTALSLLGTATLSANAYADGFLASLLAVQYLCSRSADPRLARLQWVAALCASLLKQEGLLFSACIAVPSLFAARDAMPRSLARLAVYLPALAHVAFAHALGLRSDFRGIAWGALAERPLERAREVAGALARAFAQPGYDRCDTLVWLGAAAFLVACGAAWRHPARRVEAALLVAPIAAIAAAIVAIFFLTPQDLAWHVEYAFDRLALAPGLLSIVAAALALAPGGPALPRSSGPRAP